MTKQTRTTQRHAEREKAGRTGALLLRLEDPIEDDMVVASLRDQLRNYGIDHVRGL